MLSPVVAVLLWSTALLVCIYGIVAEHSTPAERVGFLSFYLLFLVFGFVMYV